MSIGIALDQDKLAMDKCVKCLRCFLVCPLTEGQGVAAETFVQAYRMCTTSDDDFQNLTNLCLDCKRCVLACPSNIATPSVVLAIRSELRRKYGPVPGDRFLEKSPGFAKVGSVIPAVANFALRNGTARLILQGLSGVAYRRRLPGLRRGRPNRAAAARPSKAGGLGRKVWYFTGCAVDYMDEQGVGQAAAAILDHNGLDWEVAPHTCCGIVKIVHGDIQGAKRDATANVAQLGALVAQGDVIVTTCPTCGLALREDYPKLLGTDDARRVAEGTIDLFELLGWLQDNGTLTPAKAAVRMSAVYHHPCHLAAQGVGRWEILRLLEGIPGLELRQIEDSCCGSGGTEGFKQEKFDTSVAVGAPLFEEVRSSGAGVILTPCLACQLQLGQNCRLDAVHPAVVLAEALGASAAGRREGVAG